MNKPSEIEIKAWLRSLAGSMSAWSERDERMSQTIRRLIKKFFEWKERADVINVDFLGAPSINLKDAHDLILEIRDFGKEAADE